MNSICDTYESLLKSHGVSEFKVQWKTVKKKIQQNLTHIEFSRPAQNKPEQLCSTQTKNIAVGSAADITNPRKIYAYSFRLRSLDTPRNLEGKAEGLELRWFSSQTVSGKPYSKIPSYAPEMDYTWTQN